MRRLALVLPLLVLLAAPAPAAEPVPTGAFAFTIETVVPGSPREVFDAATGDISGWWDHTMSSAPLSLTIDPRPGGLFLETYDAKGNGVRHAVVTAADRGKLLRMEGPLGLAGHALLLVTTWTFTEAEEGFTRFAVEVHGSGEVHAGWDVVIESTWLHFLVDRFKAYMEGGMKPLD
jgi:uncharacterized protein YndB with AHSA1/START domain